MLRPREGQDHDGHSLAAGQDLFGSLYTPPCVLLSCGHNHQLRVSTDTESGLAGPEWEHRFCTTTAIARGQQNLSLAGRRSQVHVLSAGCHGKKDMLRGALVPGRHPRHPTNHRGPSARQQQLIDLSAWVLALLFVLYSSSSLSSLQDQTARSGPLPPPPAAPVGAADHSQSQQQEEVRAANLAPALYCS